MTKRNKKLENRIEAEKFLVFGQTSNEFHHLAATGISIKHDVIIKSNDREMMEAQGIILCEIANDISKIFAKLDAYSLDYKQKWKQVEKIALAGLKAAEKREFQKKLEKQTKELTKKKVKNGQ